MDKLFQKLSTSQKIALSFLLVILTGSVLLTLPICQTANSQATYLDNLFISVSAVCVTGLWTESIYDSYNILGQIVMVILIQTGGLGLMTIVGSIYHSMGQSFGLKNQIAMGEAINSSERTHLGSFLSRIIKYTAVIESTGALLLTFFFVPLLGFKKGIWNSIFTAVSAFCNAGFDAIGNNSFVDYQTVPILNWTVMALIVLGGIGFSVWFDVAQQWGHFRNKTNGRNIKFYIQHLMPHTKLVLIMTGTVILSGVILFLMAEWNNPSTIGNLSVGNKIMTAFFQTITMRTAGFSTVDYTLVKPVSLLVFVCTMFIGGGPGGTAGGLKVTTFALTILLAVREVRQTKYVNFAHRTVPDAIMRSAFTIALMYILTLLIGSGLLLTFNPEAGYLKLLFEAISALATVGVSAGLTPTLSTASHWILILLMYMGRIGPMTMIMSLGKKSKTYDVRYSETDIIIG